MTATKPNHMAAYWHTGSTKFPPGASTERWARAAGLDWCIVETPVTYAPRVPPEPNMSFSAMNVLYRSDTTLPLSVVPNSFLVTQPIESLAFFRKFSDFYDFTVVDAGALDGGKLLWCLLRTGQEFLMRTGESVMGHMLLSAHCDSAVAAFLNPICLIAETNTTFPASSRALAPVPVPWNDQFLSSGTLMDIAIAHTEAIHVAEALDQLASRAVTDPVARDYFSSILAAQPVGDRSLSRRARDRQLHALFDLYHRHTTRTGMGSAWGLLRAVALHVDHSRRFDSTTAQRHYAWFGAGSVKKQLAIELAFALAT